MIKVSPHFSLEEFACHDGTAYPPHWIDQRLVPHVGQLEIARAAHGGPIEVVSGYRTPTYNQAVGGKPHSQHPEGRASDVRPWLFRGGVRIHWDHGTLAEQVHAVHAFHDLVIDQLAAGALPLVGGVGYYPGKWVHIDTRPRPASGYVERWIGAGVGAEQATPPGIT